MPRFWLCGALLLAIAGLATSQQILNVNNFTSPFLLSSNDVPLVDNSANGVNVCTAQNDHIATDFTTAVKAAFYNRMICPFGIPIIAHQNVPDANIIYTANILGRFLDKNMDGTADNADTVSALKAAKVVFVLGSSATTEIITSLTTVTSTLTKAWVLTTFPVYGLTSGTNPTLATAADRLDAQKLIYENVFKTVLRYGWSTAFKADVGVEDFTSIACKEMQRIACCNPGWNDPKNQCPGQTGVSGNYQFPNSHTFRSPGSVVQGVSPMVTGTCTASTCDCVNFITQASLIYIEAAPWSPYGSQMPKTRSDIRAMLSNEFKAMFDKGNVLTRVDEVSGKYEQSVFNVLFKADPNAASRGSSLAWGFFIAAASLASALSARNF